MPTIITLLKLHSIHIHTLKHKRRENYLARQRIRNNKSQNCADSRNMLPHCKVNQNWICSKPFLLCTIQDFNVCKLWFSTHFHHQITHLHFICAPSLIFFFLITYLVLISWTPPPATLIDRAQWMNGSPSNISISISCDVAICLHLICSFTTYWMN